MVKKTKIESFDKSSIGLDNLKKFSRRGASSNLEGNIPTGHFNLDFALHYGFLPGKKDLNQIEGYNPKVPLGIPRGRITEIFGEEGSGKTSLCYRLVSSAQKLKLECMWFDAEQSFSESLAKVNGVDLENLWLSERGRTMEEIMDDICTAIVNGIKLVIVDSIAGLVPKTRMENSAEDQTMGLKARILSDNVPKIANLASEHGAAVIFINQIRSKIGVMFGSPETTTGGNTLPFFASIRLRMSKRPSAKNAIFIEDPNDAGERLYIGHYSGLKIEKNRFGKPLVDNDGNKIILDIPISYEKYFPNIEDLAFDAGRQTQVISVRNGVFKWAEKIKEDGRKAFIEKLVSDNLIGDLIDEIRKAATGTDTVLSPELYLYDSSALKVKRIAVSEEELKDSEKKVKKNASTIIGKDTLKVEDSSDEITL